MMTKPHAVAAVDQHRVVATTGSVNGITRASGNQFVTAAFGGPRKKHVSLWNADTGAEVASFGTGVGHVCWYAEQSREGLVATGFGDLSLRVWNPKDNSISVLGILGGIVASVAWSGDGQFLFSGNCGDNTVRLWNVKTGQLVAQATTKKSATWFVAMSADATKAVSGSGDKLVHVWNPMTGQETAQLSGHTGKILFLQFFPDGKRVVSASQDKSLRVWNLENGTQLYVLAGHTKQVTCARVCPDGTQIASTSSDGTIRLWNAETGTQERVISLGTWSAESIDYSTDGQELFAACRDGIVRAFALTKRPARSQKSLADLLEAVWADPSNDAPRAVLADYLTELNDPRGEFIGLQLAHARGTSSVESRRRERELLKKHQREWVGPIAPLIENTHVKFERGFVVQCRLKAVKEQALPERHRAWATVKRFELTKGAPEALVEYLMKLGATAATK